ncbi:MAG: YceI family protein [Myxococcota bacterium]
MHVWSKTVLMSSLALGAAWLLGCEEKPKNLAPKAEAPLAPAKPATSMAMSYAVDTSSSAVRFLMEAPIEKIYGDVPGGASGELFVDLMDLSKTTGLIKVDLSKLELFQAKLDEKTKEFGEKSKNDLQNKHAQAWLEISDDTPAEVRAKNAIAELKITAVGKVSAPDVTKLSGAERKVTAEVTGQLVLHGREVSKTVPVEVSFLFNGDKPSQIRVKTTKPMTVGLEEHDVRPREAFGKLAQKTLAALGNKVAAEVPIELDLVAKAK